MNYLNDIMLLRHIVKRKGKATAGLYVIYMSSVAERVDILVYLYADCVCVCVCVCARVYAHMCV